MTYDQDLLDSKNRLSKYIKSSSFSIIIGKDDNRKIGFCVIPWCKLYPKKGKSEKIKKELLRHGIIYTEQVNTIIIKNISNCLLALKLIDGIPNWWRNVVFMIEDGKHNKKEGLLKIVKKRNQESKYNGEVKWTVESVSEAL